MSEMTAKEAIVMPIANDPVLPTKIFPETLSIDSISQNSRGPSINSQLGEKAIKPVMTIAGQTVSKPFKPPSWLTVLVTIITIKGIII